MTYSLAAIDWHAMFVPSMSLAEVALRGTIMYFAILLLLRLMRREAGTVGVSDLLVVVLIADAAQNAMAGEYRSITEGVALVGTIVGWDMLLDWLSFRSPLVSRLLSPPPLLLVEDGRLNRRNLRREFITDDELMQHLRRAGVERVEDVRKCYVEGNGEISVIRRDGEGQASERKKGWGESDEIQTASAYQCGGIKRF